MPIDFQKYAMKGNEFLNLLARNLGDESDKARASRVLRSTFKVLREQLTLEESIQVIAQLPMALKGIYVDGWKVNHTHASKIKTLEDFVVEILKAEETAPWKDFHDLNDVVRSVKAVVETMAEYVSPGELEQAFGTLPREVKEVLQSWLI